MNFEDIKLPLFKKKKVEVSASTKRFQILVLFGIIAVCAIGLYLFFDYSLGSQTQRAEILPSIRSSSESRKKHLLMEWLSHLEGATSEVEWRPTPSEHNTLLSLAAESRVLLREDGVTLPQLYVHVASWGVATENEEKILLLLPNATSTNAEISLGLYLARQNNLIEVPEVRRFVLNLAQDLDSSVRKVSVRNLESCNSSLDCQDALTKLLSDNDEEVKWNAALAVLRTAKENVDNSQPQVEIEKLALNQLQSLEERVFSIEKDNTFLSRFDEASLRVFLRNFFAVKAKYEGQNFRRRLEDVQLSHPNLRLRNEARYFLNSQ